MADLKAAVIGVGSMGRNHARVYDELPGVTLAAIADTSPGPLQETAARRKVRGYSDYQEMLEKERPDVVTVAVPTNLHHEVAGAALEAGAHVLVEKPITATVEEGKALIQKGQEVGRQLMVGHIVRFNPAIRSLQGRLASGDLGRMFQVVCRRVGPFPARIRDVGVVVDLASHDLDVMRYLTGDEPAYVFAETERRIHTDHEDLLTALLRFRGGVIGMLEANWLTPVKVREILVLGERGMFRVDDLTQDLYFYENALANGEMWAALRILKGVSEGPMIRYPLRRYEPLKAEVAAFVRAVREGEPVPVSGEDGLAALRLALALTESGITHQVVEVTG
ncbi:MAG TPA: Gfo/Idh/MocA family oxidoreductase [Chloroflexi bacterium]|nr:Gfo/Idh/MocA family oxidoreductase [Chloroflexota bacterium]